MTGFVIFLSGWDSTAHIWADTTSQRTKLNKEIRYKKGVLNEDKISPNLKVNYMYDRNKGH